MKKLRALVLGFDSQTHSALSQVFDLVHIVADTGSPTEKWGDVYSFNMKDAEPTLEALNDGSYQFVINKYQRYEDINSRRYVTVNARESEIFNGFMLYFYWAHNLLKSKKIDIVLFQNFPHESFDYILYLIARYFGLRTIICHQCFVMTSRFWICEEIEKFGDMSLLPVIADKVRSNYALPEHWYYMNDVSNKWIYTLWDLVKEVALSPWRFPTAALRYYYNLEYQKSRRLTVTAFDKTKKFVYVPLHMQPELTTSAMGGSEGRYGDQLQMIEQLSLLVPPGVFIYLKENPKQTAQQRDPLFYRRIAMLLNVKFLAPDISSTLLIKKSIGVATITGTAGWEALFHGKPCLVFGNAWYSSFPGVTKFHSKMQFQNWIDNMPPSCDDLIEKLDNILTTTGEGVVDPLHAVVVSDFCPEINARNIATSLKKYIEQTSSYLKN